MTIGLHGESQSLLDAADNDFYGAHDEGDAHAASAVDSGSDDSDEAWSDESEGEPSAKRVDLGSSVEDLGSDAEENYSDAEDTHQSPATSPEERSDDESRNQLSALVEAEVRDLFHLGCKCSGQSHYTALENQRETLIRLMTSLQDLDKKALKHYILGELAASILPATAASAERRYRYHILGISVCAKVFKDVHGVGEHTLKRLKELVARGTAAVPQHGNVNFMPHNALSPDTISKTVQFLNSYACTHGLPQPVAPRGRAAAPPVYLPASHKKTDMHKLCVSALQECEPPHTLGYTSFRKIWKRYVPDVRVMTPRTDVCANCDRLRGEVARAKTEEQTVATMAALTAHTASRA